MRTTKLYMDVCCLNRPFDDQTQDRIRLEAEAVVAVLRHVASGDWVWVSSEVVNTEIAQMPDHDRRARVQLMATDADKVVRASQRTIDRAKSLEKMRFCPMDALHVACAEGVADVFLTTDDQLEKIARRNRSRLHIPVVNVLTWVEKQVGL